MATVDDLEARIAQLEIQIRTLNLLKGMLSTERTHGCTNGCTGACPDPTGNCTYGCTSGCTSGCTGGGCQDATLRDARTFAEEFEKAQRLANEGKAETDEVKSSAPE